MLLNILVAYLLGSIPFGLLVARWVKGIDIREHGSKNIGMTNVFRVVGCPWGILVFFLDSCKGYLAVAGPVLLGQQSLGLRASGLLAMAAILGHVFPVWLKFKGGKGVATSLGVFLAAAPLPTLIAFGIWVAVFIPSHIVSISSLVAAATFPLVVMFVYRTHAGFGWLLAISIILAGFIFYTHRANIKRLLAGEEKKLF